MAIPYDYQGDWSRTAQLIVHQSLRTQPGERVIIHADPTYFPELSEQVRIEIIKAGAVELCTSMLHPPALEAVRQRWRRRQDTTLKQMEDEAMAALFALADLYIWLPTSWAWNVGQTEDILKTWPGRSIHFHWIMDEADPTVFRKLSEMYEAALYIDYDALAAHQERLIERFMGRAWCASVSGIIRNPVGRTAQATTTGCFFPMPRSRLTVGSLWNVER